MKIMDTTKKAMPTVILGIDPGQTGAISVLRNGLPTHVFDMPVMGRIRGGGQEINAYELAKILSVFADSVALATLESVSAMPGQGVSSMFRFGESFGAVKGVLGALEIPYNLVTPQRWKKYFGLIGKEKDSARSLAITRFPGIADKLSRKKDTGRADAILIAAFSSMEG
jgi:crossover junction endodeoxyribonuclease RuvC